MSETLASLSRKIGGTEELKSVVRSMKAVSAASVGQYERSVVALADYHRTIELGLAACLKNHDAAVERGGQPASTPPPVSIIVIGSDQGLVGQFNDVLSDFVAKRLATVSGAKTLWAVGERIESRLADAGLAPLTVLAVPTSVEAITPLVGKILLDVEAKHKEGEPRQIYLFHNRPQAGDAYEPFMQRLMPLDKAWAHSWSHLAWPTKNLPEVIGERKPTVLALVREFLFVSAFKACAESLAAENASRLASMQRAEKNIEELVAGVTQKFRRLRQDSIDEELFDVLSGYDSAGGGANGPRSNSASPRTPH